MSLTRLACRVLFFNDHPIVRAGVRSLIEAEPDLLLLAAPVSAERIIDLYREHTPDVLIMELTLAGIEPLEAIRAIRSEFPAARVIILTSFSGDEDIRAALTVGVKGYLLNDCDGEELAAAIRIVRDGGRYYLPRVQAPLDEYAPALLTPRERQALLHIANGAQNKDIARALNIAVETAKIHVKRILHKLGAVDRTQAVGSAFGRGILRR